jgi:hypothetical protein
MGDGMSVAAVIDRALRAAGVPIDGISLRRIDDKSTWRVDFKSNATQAQRDQVTAIIEAFDPETVRPPRRVDFEDALDRLTDPEWVALDAACRNSVRLARWYERAKTRGSIDLEDPEVKTALGVIVDSGLFTVARLFELFGVKSL